MNEELKKQLVEYLGKVLAAIEKGAEFAGEQIPLVVQEKLTYDFWSATIIASLAGAVAAALGVAWYRFNKAEKWHSEVIGFSTFFLFICGVAPAALAANYALKALKIAIAPRLYIVEWLKGML